MGLTGSIPTPPSINCEYISPKDSFKVDKSALNFIVAERVAVIVNQPFTKTTVKTVKIAQIIIKVSNSMRQRGVNRQLTVVTGAKNAPEGGLAPP